MVEVLVELRVCRIESFFIEHTFCQKFVNLTAAISDFADIFLLANIVLTGGLALSSQTIG